MGLKSPKIFEYGSLALNVVLTSGVFNTVFSKHGHITSLTVKTHFRQSHVTPLILLPEHEVRMTTDKAVVSNFFFPAAYTNPATESELIVIGPLVERWTKQERKGIILAVCWQIFLWKSNSLKRIKIVHTKSNKNLYIK